MAKILIIDDDASVLETLRLLVSTEGHEVYTATGGEEALEMLGHETLYDLMITDLRMPGVNGLDLLSHVQKKQPGIGVLVVSAYLNENTSRQVQELGCRAYVSKPFKVEEVLQAINMVLKEKNEVS